MGYQILGWHSKCTLHDAIHQSRQIYLFDKDRDTKCRRNVPGTKILQRVLWKNVKQWGSKIAKNRTKRWPPIVQIVSMSHIYV